MANKPPAFQFYVKDWLTSQTIARMTEKQERTYLRLLLHAWDSDEPGSLPNDINVLSKVVKIDKRTLRDFLSKFPQTFIEVDAKLVNAKQRKIYEELVQFSQKASDRGKKGAQARWQDNASSNAPALPNDGSTPTPASSSSSSSSIVGSEYVGSGEAASSDEQRQEPENTKPVVLSSPDLKNGKPEEILSTFLGSCKGLKQVPVSWFSPARDILKETTLDEALGILRYVYSGSKDTSFWVEKITGMDSFLKFLHSDNERSLMNRYLAWKQAKTKKRATFIGVPQPEQKEKSKWL